MPRPVIPPELAIAGKEVRDSVGAIKIDDRSHDRRKGGIAGNEGGVSFVKKDMTWGLIPSIPSAFEEWSCSC